MSELQRARRGAVHVHGLRRETPNIHLAVLVFSVCTVLEALGFPQVFPQ